MAESSEEALRFRGRIGGQLVILISDECVTNDDLKPYLDGLIRVGNMESNFRYKSNY
jgi:hypothetical protein